MADVAIVTGGTRGLGRLIVTHLLGQGWKVALCARGHGHDDNLPTEYDSGSRYLETGDVSNREFVSTFVTNVVSILGKPRLLLNNAAIFGSIGSVLDYEEEEITNVLHTNLVGPQNMCRAFLEASDELSHRAIVNIGGAGIGGRNPERDAFPYLVSKSALYWFTELLATEVQAEAVCVNLLAPGPIKTSFMADVRETALRRSRDEILKEITKRENLDDTETVARVLAWINFLASPVSQGITGRLLSAVWDSPEDVLRHVASPDAYRLRRIDNTLFYAEN